MPDVGAQDQARGRLVLQRAPATRGSRAARQKAKSGSSPHSSSCHSPDEQQHEPVAEALADRAQQRPVGAPAEVADRDGDDVAALRRREGVGGERHGDRARARRRPRSARARRRRRRSSTSARPPARAAPPGARAALAWRRRRCSKRSQRQYQSSQPGHARHDRARELVLQRVEDHHDARLAHAAAQRAHAGAAPGARRARVADAERQRARRRRRASAAGRRRSRPSARSRSSAWSRRMKRSSGAGAAGRRSAARRTRRPRRVQPTRAATRRHRIPSRARAGLPQAPGDVGRSPTRRRACVAGFLALFTLPLYTHHLTRAAARLRRDAAHGDHPRQHPPALRRRRGVRALLLRRRRRRAPRSPGAPHDVLRARHDARSRARRGRLRRAAVAAAPRARATRRSWPSACSACGRSRTSRSPTRCCASRSAGART